MIREMNEYLWNIFLFIIYELISVETETFMLLRLKRFSIKISSDFKNNQEKFSSDKLN